MYGSDHESFDEDSVVEKIQKGIQLNQPNVFIPWGINEKKFLRLFQNDSVKHIIKKYYSIKSETSFAGNNCYIGIDFEKGTFSKCQFAREYDGQENFLERSHNKFHDTMIKLFGEPTIRRSSETGFDDCEWRIGKFPTAIRIHHYIVERFGLEEHLYIENLDSKVD